MYVCMYVCTFTSNCAQQNITQVKGVFRTHFRWTSPSLISAFTTNTLETKVACDMPGQIPYTSWLILIMPLSTSLLNCAISLRGEGPRSCFTTTRLSIVKSTSTVVTGVES